MRSLEKHQSAFEDLKQAVIDEPVLDLPDHTEPFEVHKDASDYVIRSMLLQQGKPQHKRLKISMRPKAGESDFIWLCGYVININSILKLCREYIVPSHAVYQENNTTGLKRRLDSSISKNSVLYLLSL